MAEIHKTDVLVIGGGIAGASAAAFLAEDFSVVLLEREDQPGYHTTGRSAAVYAPPYGPPPIRALTAASGAFLAHPPEGFSDLPLLGPRGILMVATPDQHAALEALCQEVGPSPTRRLVAGSDLVSLNPLLRGDVISHGFSDNGGQDIDVNALHSGFLRKLRAGGGKIVLKAGVCGIARIGAKWQIETPEGIFQAPHLVNAAGAWADELAEMAGVRPVGLVPKRRTVAIVPAPDGVETATLPITIDIEEQFYLKPDSGRLLISPADETPSPPCDAQPEEIDIAIGIDRIETAFDLTIRRVENKWAGLRSFVADKCPVVGSRAGEEGFFWLAGQGGYGIQTSPALGRLIAAMIAGRGLPEDLAKAGVLLADLDPERF